MTNTTKFFNNNHNSFFEGRSIEEVLLPMRKSQEYCGLEELPHFSCHNIVKNPQFESDKERYIHHLTRVFLNFHSYKNGDVQKVLSLDSNPS